MSEDPCSLDRVKEGEGAVFMVYPDDRTSFKTLMDVLRRLKTAGVKQFAAGAAETNGGVEVLHYLQGKMDMIHSAQGSAPAPK